MCKIADKFQEREDGNWNFYGLVNKKKFSSTIFKSKKDPNKWKVLVTRRLQGNKKQQCFYYKEFDNVSEAKAQAVDLMRGWNG